MKSLIKTGLLIGIAFSVLQADPYEIAINELKNELNGLKTQLNANLEKIRSNQTRLKAEVIKAKQFVKKIATDVVNLEVLIEKLTTDLAQIDVKQHSKPKPDSIKKVDQRIKNIKQRIKDIKLNLKKLEKLLLAASSQGANGEMGLNGSSSSAEELESFDKTLGELETFLSQGLPSSSQPGDDKKSSSSSNDGAISDLTDRIKELKENFQAILTRIHKADPRILTVHESSIVDARTTFNSQFKAMTNIFNELDSGKINKAQAENKLNRIIGILQNTIASIEALKF